MRRNYLALLLSLCLLYACGSPTPPANPEPDALETATQAATTPHKGSTAFQQYAQVVENRINWGAYAKINVWAPAVPTADYSTNQMWVSAGNENLHAGVHVNYALYRDNRPHLFTYATRYVGGKPSGCFNGSCGDFVQVSTTIRPGNTVGSVSVSGGQQYELEVYWVKDFNGGDWWLRVQGEWVGYYPRTLFVAMANYATSYAFGGTVTNTVVNGRHTTADMGSGAFPSAWYTRAAYQRNLGWWNVVDAASRNMALQPATALTVVQTDVKCYAITYGLNDAAWGTYIYFGGTGYDAVNCY